MQKYVNLIKSCRSRQELSNKYLLAKIGVDTAENEPLEVWGKIPLHARGRGEVRAAAFRARS